jgi:hypothetical protein
MTKGRIGKAAIERARHRFVFNGRGLSCLAGEVPIKLACQNWSNAEKRDC